MGGTGMFFLLQSIFFIILLALAFYKKERIKSYETSIFSKMIYISIIELVLEFCLDLMVPIHDQIPIIIKIIGKLYCSFIIIWISLLSYYVAVNTLIMKNKNNLIKKISNIYMFSGLLFIAFVFLLDINFYYDGDVYYSYGWSVRIDYLASFIHCLLVIVFIIINGKKFKNRKFIPVFIFLIIGNLCGYIQMNNPQLLLSTFVHVFITFVMYFTIENPDIKMLNEMYKNKELMEQNYEDKYNFLFEMTQDTREPLTKINHVYNEIKDSNDPKVIKDGMKVINTLTRQLDFSINNVLNISSLDIQKIKIIETKYNLNKFCDDLQVKIKNDVKDGVNLSFEVPGNCPTLYGDYMKLRQILFSLLSNSIKNTEKGNVILKVNLIEKYDVCRVIFKISDTGRGIPIEKINEILSATGELDKNELESLVQNKVNISVCQKVIKIMGGHLMIKSDDKSGTDITLTIDQKVYHEKENSVLSQYEKQISNYKNALLVCQDEKLIKHIKRRFNDANIVCSHYMYGLDAVDKIKSGKNYDFIIIEDDMKEINGYMTFEKLKEIKNFDIPCIILLKDDKKAIAKQYLIDGFNRYILINNIDNGLDKLINE